MKLHKPQFKIIGSRQVSNASFIDVIKYLLTFGKKGRLYIIEDVDVRLWETYLDQRVNCRCSVLPIKSKHKIVFDTTRNKG